MRSEREPDIADQAPWSDALTDYDLARLTIYLRLLDAEREGADWREVARVVLRQDPDTSQARARRCWESHMQRARWMTESGYRLLLDVRGP